MLAHALLLLLTLPPSPEAPPALASSGGGGPALTSLSRDYSVLPIEEHGCQHCGPTADVRGGIPTQPGIVTIGTPAFANLEEGQCANPAPCVKKNCSFELNILVTYNGANRAELTYDGNIYSLTPGSPSKLMVLRLSESCGSSKTINVDWRTCATVQAGVCITWDPITTYSYVLGCNDCGKTDIPKF